MKIKSKLICTLLVLVILGIQSIFASGNKLGTAAAPELLIPMGAKNVAMAGANIADVSKTDAIYWNPAGVANIENTEASFTYLNYFADMNLSYFALALSISDVSAVGISIQSFDIGNIDVTTIDNPEGTGEQIQPDYITLGVTYSRRFTDKISFGINNKLISETIGSMSATAFAWDFGIQYKSDAGIDFGITLKNIGTELQFSGTGTEFDSNIPFANPNATTRKTNLDLASAELPTTFNIGAAYKLNIDEVQDVKIVGQFTNSSFALDHITGGLEYDYRNLLFVRGGYSMALFEDNYPSGLDESEFGLHAGFGINLDIGGNKIFIDYAYRPMETFGSTNYFTVGFEL